MSAAIITADWFLLGRDLYYRKMEIYPSMSWQKDVELENLCVASAPYGGPFALRRDDRKIVKVQGSAQPVIHVYSASGKSITSFKWSEKPIVHMGWSNEEKLIVVQDDGGVAIYDMFGKLEHKFNIFQKVQENKVVDARIFTNPRNVTGVAVMTSNYKVYFVNSLRDIKTRQLSEIPKSESVSPTAWEVVSKDTSSEVLLAANCSLFWLRRDEHTTSKMLKPDITAEHYQITEMAVSLNARHLCLFTDTGYLWMGSTDLTKKYHELDTEIERKPKQLLWCGNDAVIAYWEMDHTILVVGKYGQKMTYQYDSAIHLVAEIDGVRIVSNYTHELLQKVPDEVQKIFRINSTEPGSFLLEASKQYQKGSHKANEYISLVKNSLEEAVNQCLAAVGFEFDQDIQKKLIRAAQFGKCFVPGMSPDQYVEMCRILRVLNAIRSENVGIPLTITQLKFMRHEQHQDLQSQKIESYQNLLDRLIARNMYFLALEVAKYLRMPDKEGCSHILLHWAKYKVSQPHVEEEVVAREIAEKLGVSSAISYRQIAEKASESGKKKLAIKLLDYESKASEQVELLLKLGENTPALIKAIESGDTDLIYMVISKLRKTMHVADFKMTIRNFPIAQSLYIIYCREHNAQALKEIYIQEDDFASQAEMSLADSVNPKNSHMKEAFLLKAAEDYKKGRKDLNASMCEETLKLLKFQRDLEEKLNVTNKFSGKSVHDTCKILLEIKEFKWAEKLRNDFKVSEKRYWWLRILTLASQGEWVELERLSKVKKSPIGYTPFVDVCLANNKEVEAKKYLAKVPPDMREKYVPRLGNVEEPI